ncbi:uncharacterized protein B0I36DRAFT_245594 [Microdochium trichocladiopsis]|uniref:Stealth protein CR3 conserved region 3 domain-containing protein n=1 Tax=Microdochium trichocladiopsis TaxID=1682393 RepID=A0A9P9BPQ1_9PEZI|nr:uncharacterized protein B0I36DRAFT_245594 [Microdochium trichocladiopsis]KAH7029472.1 hypothetical protein B0I36DRAFT_245594 [Microdochium trichocladiopsis]
MSSSRRFSASASFKGGDPPIEARELWTCRPVRKVVCLLCIAAGGWLFLGNRLGASEYPTYSPLSLYRPSRADASTASRWVGGGAAGVSSSQEQQAHLNTAGTSSSEDHAQSGNSHSASRLPQVLRIPLSDAVADVELEGWEDDWFAFGQYDAYKHGRLEEPKIDFVYNWVNGSEDAFNQLRHKYELESPLNDPEGKWIAEHGVNRYRDWNELRYSLRSLDTNAAGFLNKVQILVNSYTKDGQKMQGQRPTWMRDDIGSDEHLQILPQEEFFSKESQKCLPTFNSLSIESQIHLTPSNTDRLVALSDDMLLGMPHAASDYYSPLFGSVMAFKPDKYNVKALGSQDKWPTFGEKPFLYYTSYLLNHRFGQRARRVQAHFGHSVSRAVMHEAMASFPGPAHRGVCERFRGESHFQLYPWFTAFHYSIERFREALLWGFIVSKSDANADGYLDWHERQAILQAIETGWSRLDPNRERMYYRLPEELEAAGLERPKVNVNIQWTSLDGPETIRGIKCYDFAVDKCFGDSFGSPLSDASGSSQNPDFSAAAVLSRLSTQHTRCGDCLIKFLLSSEPAAASSTTTHAKKHRGLEPLLPPRNGSAAQKRDRQVVLRALKKYQHTVVDTDAMKFVMVKDAEQAERELLERGVRMGRKFGQWCLNDDVMTTDDGEVGKVKDVMGRVFEELWPVPSRWEKVDL